MVGAGLPAKVLLLCQGHSRPRPLLRGKGDAGFAV